MVEFLKEMDSSIWGPPENQDESSYPANCWQYNLYFDPRLDVIEQDALNEESCLQVLKILITKADSEIAELEDDILMLQSQLACACADKKSSDMCFAVLHKKIDNLESLLRDLKNENEQPAETGIRSSNLPEEGLTKMEAIDNHTKDMNTVEFKDNYTAQADNTVLASLVQVRNHQKAPAETTLEDRHASEQGAKEYSSKQTQKGVWPTKNDFTIEESLPHLLNSKRNDRSKPLNKLKRGGDGYGDNTIKKTQLAEAKRAAGFADISATSQSHLRKRSKFSGPVIQDQDNKDQRSVQNRLVKSHGRTSHDPPVINGSSSHDNSNADVSPVSSIRPSPCIEDIYNMTLVQLRAMANHQLNIYGVSNIRKADLQELLRSKLQAKDRNPFWTHGTEVAGYDP
ncbi:PREDICTED: uncharacterized protein LOC109224996 isoform X2 [Nicotiana attenuata]|uniref:uncharacterized protein LOC109224996 isoform X2 n=1 Tax=Nicotiana attenuata TaxID=49451 RepID=UPI0009053E17|nr:PREDICTED: uncharacterized protein LOC109224996 isoform X2 [Nicotiana attenuata]